ncbi:alpha/beta hydrolase, partial [Streptomyces parvus]
METCTLATAGADLVYDVRGPLPTADGRPPLFLIGHPMDASGFAGAVSDHRPDVDAIAAAPTRVVIAVGEESRAVQTGRTSDAAAVMARAAGDRLP